jgi:glycosyltransferase involved in cell wall biosynthesis
VNAGKTEALKTGFALTTGQIVIVQDADLEYDPAEIGDAITPIVQDTPMWFTARAFWCERHLACCTSTTTLPTKCRRFFRTCARTST